MYQVEKSRITLAVQWCGALIQIIWLFGLPLLKEGTFKNYLGIAHYASHVCAHEYSTFCQWNSILFWYYIHRHRMRICVGSVGRVQFRKPFSSNLIVTPAVFLMWIALRDIIKLISSETSMTTSSKIGFPLSAC